MAAKGTKKPKADPRPCTTCGKIHPGGAVGTFVMPSLLDPTEYACSKSCYDAWCAIHPVSGAVNEHRRHIDDDEMSVARDPGTPLFEV